jgi:hypothetical protein
MENRTSHGTFPISVIVHISKSSVEFPADDWKYEIVALSNSAVTLALTTTVMTTKIVASSKNGLDLTSNNQFCNHTALKVVLFNFSGIELQSDRLKDFKMAKKDTKREDSNNQ